MSHDHSSICYAYLRCLRMVDKLDLQLVNSHELQEFSILDKNEFELIVSKSIFRIESFLNGYQIAIGKM